MKTYCSKCGHPNAYTTKKPKFCNECGESLGIFASGNIPATLPEKEPEVIKEEKSSNEIIEKVPNLSELDVEIETGKVTGVRLGEIVDAAAAGPLDEGPIGRHPKTKGKGKRLTKKARTEFNKQTLDNWKKESGAIRKK